MFGFIVAWSIIMCIVFDYRGITAFGGFLILPILCVALGYGICRVKYILSDNAQIKKQFLPAIYASIGLTAIIFILLFVGIFDLLSTLNYFIIFCIVALIAQTFIDLPALLLRNTPLSKNERYYIAGVPFLIVMCIYFFLSPIYNVVDYRYSQRGKSLYDRDYPYLQRGKSSYDNVSEEELKRLYKNFVERKKNLELYRENLRKSSNDTNNKSH